MVNSARRTFRSPRRAAVAVAAGCAVTGLLLPGAAPATATGPGHERYVALGDSYTSSPLTGLPQPGSPLGCFRSNNNYPSVIAQRLRPASFRDASCGGAQTKDMTAPQDVTPGGPNPPQFDSLRKNTTLVTLEIGGNDIGFGKLMDCFRLSVGDPDGSPCKDAMVKDDKDPFVEAINATAPRLAAVLRGIHRRAPKADVYVLGYPALLPARGDGCYPYIPLAKGDVPWLRGVQRKLHAMIAARAAAGGARYVDLSVPGHDMCQVDPTKRWVEGPVPLLPAAPVHPNASGSRNMARIALEAIRGS
ncbi:SGNH/GDSL hydrolase family protein [Streptomyces arenae]|nr:SGNH/GDSL hydrolase family protein [Streptomyces arenae]